MKRWESKCPELYRSWFNLQGLQAPVYELKVAEMDFWVVEKNFTSQRCSMIQQLGGAKFCKFWRRLWACVEASSGITRSWIKF